MTREERLDVSNIFQNPVLLVHVLCSLGSMLDEDRTYCLSLNVTHPDVKKSRASPDIAVAGRCV